MTLDLAQNVPIHTLKVNYSKPSKLTEKSTSANLASKGWSIPHSKTGRIVLKHCHNEHNRPTPISKPTTLSQAEALNCNFIWYHKSFKND